MHNKYLKIKILALAALMAVSWIALAHPIYAPDLNSHVLSLGLRAYKQAQSDGFDKQGILTIIDYSLPSAKPRLWVINVKKGTVLFHTLVAHGANSGLEYADRFSNNPHSHETSIGVYKTGITYDGKHGYSMRLFGLDKGFNNNAYKRDIVMHSASYVSKAFDKEYDRIGRSWGCMALSQKVAHNIINTIKDGTVILAYYPNKKWIESSKYLQT